MVYIRNQEHLTKEQAVWLRRSTVGFFGPGYYLARRLWLILVINFVLRSEINTMLGDITTVSGIMWKGAMWVLIVSTLLYGLLVLWGVKNARRWSWNVNKWHTFEAFVQSEKTWHWWGIAGLILAILIALLTPFIDFPYP